MKKMKNDNKGFTLVELIVVLVILAILAAILVPALLCYIDEAKQKQLVLHGKSVYTAAQAVASQAYAKNDAPTASSSGYAKKIAQIADMDEFTGDASEVDAYVIFGATVSGKPHNPYTVIGVKYREKDQWVQLIDGAWESGSGASYTNAGVELVVNGTYATEN